MADWRKLIERRFNSDPCEGAKMKLGPPANNSRLDELEQEFGFTFPVEFRSLYSTCDGYGVAFDNKPNEVYWEFRPTKDLERFVSEMNNSLASTHPSESARFFPFYDWSTGDSAGYLLDENFKLLPGIYDFHHDRYEFDESQNFNDFVVLGADTIAGYLEKIIAECENVG